MKHVVLSGVFAAVLLASPSFAASKSDANAPVYEALQNHQWTQAESMLRETLKANANDPVAMLNLAYVLQNTGRASEAVSLYEQVLQQDKDPAVAVGQDDRVRAKILAQKRIGSIYSAKR